jgi:hypothetical protein
MADRPNFVLVPDSEEPDDDPPPSTALALFGKARSALRSVTAAGKAQAVLRSVTALRPFAAALPVPPAPATETPTRPRLIFGVDATASREPAWAAARSVTDALVRALPGELDVALAVHGGSRLHTFTPFTSNPATLRDRAAGLGCIAGYTRMLPILDRAMTEPGVRVVVYIGDVFEESLSKARRLADTMGLKSIRLFVLHDTADWTARRDGDLFADLARRTGGCVLPFDANAPDRLRDLLGAVAVYAVGGERLLHERRSALPGATLLLEHLNRGR